ncbi:TetR/AcrR family transcriptional regulator [Catenuloplanes atrovinosus]|uniref:AcrR family transcriptional regulator n=1 Tax=Catenuloplanes atrovinosus TaxID=137266 RepID=A0AAE3YMD6_9ACTN|nr:TetR/AcrR family transcriptional regulator [Catenuloplanes atrovinosus]MDR7274848.1 AcrR family transcriptional regulator [Catenuloplanes atrovinosus]
MADIGMPRSLRVLWDLEPPSKRPAQALTLERIVATAIEIADADGIATLSMARLAERLGSATMSLYRHVANKDELLIFMAAAAPGTPPAIDPEGDWREGLLTWARALRQVYLRHPWILIVNPGRPPIDPGQLLWADAGLAALGRTPLRGPQRLSSILAVLNYVRGEAQISAALADSDWADEEMRRGYTDLMRALVTPDRFPHLAGAIEDGAFAATAESEVAVEGADFEFGLARVLDGIAHLIDTA